MKIHALVLTLLVYGSVTAIASQGMTAVGVPESSPQDTSPPTLFRIDGRLTAAGGEARTGPVVLVASLYANQDDATPLWIEQQVVNLGDAGRYSLLVGSTLPDGIPREHFLSGEGRWIGVAVQGEEELLRVMLVTVPYALRAREADTLAGRSATDFVLSGNLADSVKAAMAVQRAESGSQSLPGPASTGGTPESLAAATNALVKYTSAAGAMDSSAVSETGGVMNVSGFGRHSFSGSGAGGNALRLENTTSGSGALSDLQLDASTAYGRIQVYSPGYATFGPLVANGMAVRATPGMTGGLSLSAESSSGVIRFFAGGMSERMRLSSEGVLSVFGPGTHLFSAGSSGFNALKLENTSSGSGAFADLQINASTIYGRIQVYSPSYSSSGPQVAGGMSVRATAGMTGGLSLAAESPSGSVRIYSGGPNERLRIDEAGNVGIGTASPSAKLHVAGNVMVDGNIGAKYQDVAEWVQASGDVAPGTIVIVDPSTPNSVVPATAAYDTRVAGAVSRQPGLVLGEGGEGRALVSQSGRVLVKVDASYGAITPGDLLVTSPTPGHAMVSKPMVIGGQTLHRPGTLLGKALEPWAAGRGEILVLLTLQ